MSDINLNKHFQATIINTSKKLKEIMFEEFKKYKDNESSNI